MIEVNELEGDALDDAVALALGWERATNGWIEPTADGCGIGHTTFSFKPSTDWRIGGPIIEREGINLGDPQTSPFSQWMAAVRMPAECVEGWGPTPLIAAMRAFVAVRSHRG